MYQCYKKNCPNWNLEMLYGGTCVECWPCQKRPLPSSDIAKIGSWVGRYKCSHPSTIPLGNNDCWHR